MQQHYIVFNMSNYDKRGYLQVGIAPRADVNLGIAKQYDEKFNYYNPSKEDQSTELPKVPTLPAEDKARIDKLFADANPIPTPDTSQKEKLQKDLDNAKQAQEKARMDYEDARDEAYTQESTSKKIIFGLEK